jgi:hypothetical protein
MLQDTNNDPQRLTPNELRTYRYQFLKWSESHATDDPDGDFAMLYGSSAVEAVRDIAGPIKPVKLLRTMRKPFRRT